MHDQHTDPRVVARPHGGFDVTTSKCAYHVLDSGLLGWGVFQGPNLDIALTTDERLAIGAADPQDLIRALLDSDTPEAETNTTATTEQTNTDEDTDGM